MSIEGVRFGDAWPNRMPTDFDGIPVQVISRKDLIANKRAVGRPLDLVDVTNLIEAECIVDRQLEEPKTPKRKRPKGRNRGIER
jgi:hypothetical protein